MTIQDTLTALATVTETLIALYAFFGFLSYALTEEMWLVDEPVTPEEFNAIFDRPYRSEPTTAAKTMTPQPGMIITLNDNAAYPIPEHAMTEDYNTAYQQAVELGIKGINRCWKLATIQKKIKEATNG